MSTFNASIWAIRFDGTPPQPSVMALHKDQQWTNIQAVRWWVADYFSKPFPHAPVHAVFIVGRDCNALVLSGSEITDKYDDL